jgi:hypothetical protein
MDAQTRHGLKQNELAQFLSRINDSLGERGKYVTIAIGAVIVLVIAWRVWNWNQARSIEQSWEDLMSVRISESAEGAAALDTLRTIAGSSSGDVQRWAKLRLASGLIQQANFNPSQRDAYVREAIEMLDPLSKLTTHPGIAAAAQFALATVYETQGKLDEARKAYQAIAANEAFAGIPYRTLAQQRAEDVGELNLNIQLLPGLAPGAQVPATQPSWFDADPVAPVAPPPPVESTTQPASAPGGDGDGDAPPGGEDPPQP